MRIAYQPPRFWLNWLLAVALGVVAFGLVLVIVPPLARQGFSLLVYSSPERIDSFGYEPVRYISVSHAVMGSTMVGWGVALFYVTRELISRGSRHGWNVVALSVAAWFVPDTSYSLLAGYWQNALLNAVFLVLFTIPLWNIRSTRLNDA